MSNEVTEPTADQMSDVPMDTPEKGKGKAPAMAQDPMDDEEGSSEEDEEVKHTQTRFIELNTNLVGRTRTKATVNAHFA